MPSLYHSIIFYWIWLLFYLPFSQPTILFQEGHDLIIWFYTFSLSIISTIFAYLFYIGGLSMGD